MKIKKLYENQLIFIYLMLLGGCVSGVLGSMILSHESLSQLDVFLIPVSENIQTYETFLSVFFIQVLFVFCIALVGTSLMGLFILAFVLFVKGIQAGMTCMMFIFTYQLKGVLGIGLTLIPQLILDLLPILIIAVFAIDCSSHIMYACVNHTKLNIKNELNKGLNHLIVAFVCVLICSYLKATLIIGLIRFFNQF